MDPKKNTGDAMNMYVSMRSVTDREEVWGIL